MIEISHHNMAVMAGAESSNAVGPAKDESLSTNRLQWLRQRKDTLQEKLAQKNKELKKLCIEEAELTGVLPPEIPLEPGESPPTFRKRNGTNINHSQNLINKLKTAAGPEESALELEKQVQINIAESALAALNDPLETKASRKKHRSLYQQSQRRLQEINAQLNFIRQSHGGAKHSQSLHIPLHNSQSHLQPIAKHRTKKPRPPLDTVSSKNTSPKPETRNILQENGVSLSPSSGELNFNFPSYDLQDLQQSYPQPSTSTSNRATYHAPSPVEQQRLSNQNNNVGYRSRSHSQTGYFVERSHRPVPNTYTEEERQILYRQLRLKRESEEKLRNQILAERYQESEANHRRSAQISYHENDPNTRSYDTQSHEVPLHYRQGKPKMAVQSRDSVDNAGPTLSDSKQQTYVSSGYWMRVDGEVIWCPMEGSDPRQQPSPIAVDNRFGSLDRRKQVSTHHHLSTGENYSRYHTVAIGPKNPVIIHPRQHAVPPKVPTPDGARKHPPPSRVLLRTQSLGSVESWQNTPATPNSEPDTNRNSPGPKLKEKEWYETSLDSASPPPPPPLRAPPPPGLIRRHNPPIKERAPVRSNSIPANRRPKELTLDEQQQLRPLPPVPVSRCSEVRFSEQSIKEIPAESKSSLGSQENSSLNVNNSEAMLPLSSPTSPGNGNHTVVQPGKYQPYREVTKPFEMSDFYKYSTKFRKRVESTPNSNDLKQQNDSSPPNPLPRSHSSLHRNSACPSYVLR